MSALSYGGGPLRFAALAVLATAFWGRVLAQLIQWIEPVSWLPSFDSWQSGAVSYGLLVALQAAIIAVQLFVLWAVRSGRFVAPRLVRYAVIAIGVVYFGFMLFRLVAGFTFLRGDSWFDAPLPSTFHLVLAGFVMVAGFTLRTDRAT